MQDIKYGDKIHKWFKAVGIVCNKHTVHRRRLDGRGGGGGYGQRG
jgi:hypothetical protein